MCGYAKIEPKIGLNMGNGGKEYPGLNAGLAVLNTPLSGRRVARGSQTFWPPFEQDVDARSADARHGRVRAASAACCFGLSAWPGRS